MSGIIKATIAPFFQPIICVDTGDIYGYEVLGRYYSGTNIHSLGQFFHNPGISSQEKVQVDRTIRFKALDMTKDSDSKTKLFINIQPEWLVPYIDQDKILPTVELLRKYNINGEKIIIEICEDSCGDIEILSELVKRYRDVGCKIAIDDVGEGFSNLERVAVLHPDYLKIGAGLIMRSKGNHLLESIGGFCEKAGTSLVLEEVENMDQFQMGLDAGVRYFQGYLFAVPQPNPPDIIERASCTSTIKQGLDEYLDRKNDMHLKMNQLTDTMNIFLYTALDDLSNIHPLPSPEDNINRLLPILSDNCLRLYICNNRGQQLTSNYTRNHQQWMVEADYIGRNWCWRPYFFSKVEEAKRSGRGVFSQPYRDLDTHKLIYTFIFPVNDSLFLFMDYYC